MPGCVLEGHSGCVPSGGAGGVQAAPRRCVRLHGQACCVLRPLCARLNGWRSGGRAWRGGPPAPGRSAASLRPDRGPASALPLAHVLTGLCAVWPRRGRALPRGRPGSTPTAPPRAPGGPGVTTVLFATSVRLPQICSPFKCGLFLCAALWGERVKGAEITARVGGFRVTLIRGWRAVACRFLGCRGNLCFRPGGHVLGVRWLYASSPLEWAGGGGVSCSCVLPTCPAPTSQDRPEEDAKAPRGVALGGVGTRAGSGQGAPPSPPHPHRQGSDSEWGGL